MRSKKIKNRIISTILILVICFLAGCSKSDSEEVQRYAWPLGSSSPEDTVTGVYAEKFVEEVDRLSDGKMKIDLYFNSTIGGDKELLESCADGDIPFVIQNTAPQTSFMPEMAVFDLPCAFPTLDEARAAVDNPEFYGKVQSIYQQDGYRLLGISDQGFRVMTTNVEVTDFEDFKGQKIRTMENSNHLAFWQALQANPTPMAFSEVYIGLQQNTIDAQENPYEVIVSGKLYEQQDYVVQTNHLPHYICLFMSDEFYQGLTPKQQKIIDEAAEIALAYSREQADVRVEDRLRLIEESGTEIITLSEEMRLQMVEKSQSLYDKVRKDVGDELVDAYLP